MLVYRWEKKRDTAWELARYFQQRLKDSSEKTTAYSPAVPFLHIFISLNEKEDVILSLKICHINKCHKPEYLS